MLAWMGTLALTMLPPEPGHWSLDEQHSLLPAPNGPLSNGSATLSLPHGLAVSINCSSPIVEAAAARYVSDVIFAWGPASKTSTTTGPSLLALRVEVGDTAEAAPQLGMDESYVLDVPSAVNGTATLRAPAVWGALRGLETLAQLVEYSPSSGRYLLRSAPWHIADRPQFAHRGLMIDTARHWLPVRAIKRQIDALAATKMNTLHWHATDAASFPLELQTFPRLAAAGAFSLGAAHRMTYSVAEQEEIVEHARTRGVRLVLELDLPGHADAWSSGAPEGAFLPCAAGQAILDVTSAAAAAFVDAVVGEIASRFPERVLHLGGDEVGVDCWNRSAAVRAWLAAHPSVRLEQLYGRYMLAAFQRAAAHGRRGITWNPGLSAALNFSANGSEAGRGAPPAGALAHLWSTGEVGPLMARGFGVVVSMGYYFNAAPTISSAEQTWEQIYTRDPACYERASRSNCVWSMPASLWSSFLGAEACQWGEATDEFNLEQKTWWRLPALAERLWTSNAALQARGVPFANGSSVAGYHTRDVVARLVKHRCRLLQRGVQAQAYATGYSARSKWQQCQGWLPASAASARRPTA